MLNSNTASLPVSIPLSMQGNDNGFFGNEGLWAVIILAIIFGWGNGGSIFGGGGNSGAATNYVLSSDFATIQRQLSDGFNSIDNALDRQNAGICDLGYTQLSLNNQTNTNMLQGFNGLQSQIAQCCCDVREGISGVNYNLATQANGISRQLERGFADMNYNMATNTCTLKTEIDRSADRIIDYLSQEKMQTLRDENFALRLAASQERQNNYLVSKLDPNPCPISAYVVQPPQTVTFPVSCGGVASYANYNNGCGCN